MEMLTPSPAARSPGAFRRRDWVVVLLVGIAFLVSCALARGGFFSAVDPGDVGRYHDFAKLMQKGQLPYRNFYMEYPPGAIPAFLAPLSLSWLAHYNLAFKFTVAVAGLALVLACAIGLRLLGADRAGRSRRTGSWLPLPLRWARWSSTATTCGRLSSASLHSWHCLRVGHDSPSACSRSAAW